MEYLKPWGRPSKALVQEIEARLRQELKNVVETEFAEHAHGGLQITIWYALYLYDTPLLYSQYTGALWMIVSAHCQRLRRFESTRHAQWSNVLQ